MQKLTRIMLVALLLAGCDSGQSDTVARVAGGGSDFDHTSTAAATTTEAAKPPVSKGTRDEPLEAGTAVVVGDWAVAVLSATPDGTEQVLAENQFNEPPEDGHQFLIIEIAAQNVGVETDSLFTGLNLAAVGAGAVAYDYSTHCGVIPNEINDFSEVFPGGMVRGNICWPVTAQDAESLVLIVEPALSFDEERAFISIPTDGSSYEAPFVTTANATDAFTGVVEIGTTVQVGDWDIAVVSATPDATEAVLAENPFNELEGDDRQFFVVEVSATYVGEDSESVFAGLTISAVGDVGVAYDYSASCGVVPAELDQYSEVFPGGTVQGNLCWAINTADADSLVLMVEPSFNIDERVFMDLGNEG